MIHFDVMTESDIEAVHLSTLRVLAETGIILHHPEGREIFNGAGASILGDRVFLPPDLVERGSQMYNQSIYTRT